MSSDTLSGDTLTPGLNICNSFDEIYKPMLLVKLLLRHVLCFYRF